MNYKLIDTGKIVSENDLREMLYRYEIQDLLDNKKEYFKGFLNLEYQFSCIRVAVDGEIGAVINMLETNWNVPISEPFL